MSTMTPEERYQAVWLLGPWLIGSFLEVLMQGILLCQFGHYVSWYGDDKTGFKLAVLGLFVLTCLKSIQSFSLVWILLIEHFTDLPGAILLDYTTWWQSGNPLMVAVIGVYVQTYFCYRLRAISKTIWVVVPIAIIFGFAFIAICVATYYITTAEGPKIAMWFAAHLSSVFCGDLVLCLATAYFLIRSKKSVLPQTVGLITALVRLTFQTAAPAAFCAMLNLIFSQIYGSDRIISTTFNQALPKLYAISMMWTLNARRSIRAVHSSQGMSSSTENRSRRIRTGRDGDVELGALGGIQIHTHSETIRQVTDVASFEEHDHKPSHSSPVGDKVTIMY